MKIGIMTLHWGRNNYGQFLQHYALQISLRKMGYKPFLINYIPTPEKVVFTKRIKESIVHPLRIINRIFFRFADKYCFRQAKRKRCEDFETFYKKYFALSAHRYSNIEELRSNPPEAEIYLTGSDQVWNPFGNMTTISPFFLDFGDENIRRVSYAASWGRTVLPESEKKLIAPLLKKFSAVTVRETSGIELCAQCGMQHAEITPDPTLLLCADDYRNIMKCPADMKKNEKYLVLYRLRNSDDFDYSTIFSYARKKGISVKYITGNSLCDIRPQCFASIEEWLYLIDHAEYVVTNSFHGAVFAILFQKKFAVIPLTGEKKSMNHRIDSLFKMAEMEPRYLDSFSILDTPWTGNITEVHQRANEVLKKIILSEK